LPSTQYQVKVVAEAEEGTTIAPAQSVFTTSTGRPPLAFKSDLFDSTSIDGSRWVFINPEPQSTLALVQGQSIEAVTIAIPGGTGHDIWTGNNAPRLVQPATNMDFQAETKFTSLPSSEYQLEGILAEQDFENFIRCDFFSDASGLNVFTASFEQGVPTVRGKVRIPAQSPLFLRVTRTGDMWKSFYSPDSISWTLSSTFTSSMRVNAIGVYGGNAPGLNSPAPAFTSVIDYFVNLVEKANDVPLAAPEVPRSFSLAQNYPNPFNPTTGVRFQVPGVSDVKLVVYDLLGREVAVLVNEKKAPGTYKVSFDASGLASGVYIYRLTAGSFTQAKQMLVVK